MPNNLTNMPEDELQTLLHASRHVLISLSDSIADRPDMHNAIAQLMISDDMLETFSDLDVREPELMRLVLQASVAALVNVQSAEAVELELKRRAVKGN